MVGRSDKQLAEWIDNHGDGLTPWECKYLDSVLKQLDQGRTLSDKQREILDRIYKERC